jgi:hypothetical protein
MPENEDFSPKTVEEGQKELDEALDASGTNEIKIDEFSVESVQKDQEILDKTLDRKIKPFQARASGVPLGRKKLTGRR